jgi:hypothetical protein
MTKRLPDRKPPLLTLTVSLSRPQAEKLTAKAIREGKSRWALVAEILEASSDRCSSPSNAS